MSQKSLLCWVALCWLTLCWMLWRLGKAEAPPSGLNTDVRLGWKALPNSMFQHSLPWVSKPIKTFLFLFFVETLKWASLFVPGNGLVSQILDLSEQSYHVTAEQRALKNVMNCLNTNIYSYLKTSGGQTSNLYLNAVHFFNSSVN